MATGITSSTSTAFTPAQWQAKEAEYRAETARNKALEARTVDIVNPGEEQTSATTAQEPAQRPWFLQRAEMATPRRSVFLGLETPGDKPLELRVTYWGSDGGRVFDILVDGKKLLRRNWRTGIRGSSSTSLSPARRLTQGQGEDYRSFPGPPRQHGRRRCSAG